MWPYVTAGSEKMVWQMLPPMLQQQKPTWMTKLELKTCVLVPSCSHVHLTAAVSQAVILQVKKIHLVSDRLRESSQQLMG